MLCPRRAGTDGPGVGRGAPRRARPPPRRPALTLRSRRERSASGLGRSAPDKARGAPGRQWRLRAESGRPRRARCDPGLHPPGPPFVLRVRYGVVAAARPARAGGGRGRRPSGVGLPAVSHGLLPPPPRPCRRPTPARPGQRPPRATAEPGKPPEGCCGTAPGSQGERRSQDRRKVQGGTRPSARSPVSPAGTSAEPGRRGGGLDGAGSLRCPAPVRRPLPVLDKPWLWDGPGPGPAEQFIAQARGHLEPLNPLRRWEFSFDSPHQVKVRQERLAAASRLSWFS